eukprot:g6523.t1
MWAPEGEEEMRQAEGAGRGGVMCATGTTDHHYPAVPARARPPRPRPQKSADLDVLSGSSSDESSSTEDEGSSAQRFSLRHIPPFSAGDTTGEGGGDDCVEWRAKNVRNERPSAAKPPASQSQDGGGGNPSPKSTDTARISSSSLGTIVAEARESRCASQDQAPTQENWVDNNSGWELAGEGTGTTRERQALRAEHRRRQERVREEAAVAAAAEVAAAGGDVNAVAAAAVAAAAAAAAREGFRGSRPRARWEQQQQQQQQQQQPPRKPGKRRVKGSRGGSSGGSSGGDGGEDPDFGEDSSRGGLAVAADGQRVRLSTNDFQTPVRRPLSGGFADPAASAEVNAPAPAPAPATRGGCQVCAPNGGGGSMPMLEAAAGGGGRTCGCGPAEAFAQTGELTFVPLAPGAPGFDPLGEGQLAFRRGDGGDEMKQDREFPSSNSFNYSTSSTSSRGRGRAAAAAAAAASGEGKHSGSYTIDSSLHSNSLLAASEARRAESLVDVIDHPGPTGGHRKLVDSFRTSSLRDTGSSSTSSSAGSRRRSSSERRRRKGLLGGLKKGMGVVWEKIAADHPQPLPIDKKLSKEEQRAKHVQLEIRRRNDCQTNSMAEQHVLQSVMMREEKFTR